MKSTVLLIDDDPLDIKSLQLLMESWDFDVICAHSGEDGLHHLSSIPVDLVISDVYMPGMHGEDVVKAVKEVLPWLPVVLVTGKADVKSAVKAMRLGAFDYVIKPPDESELRLTVERALEHSRLRRENEFLRAELSAGGMYGERLIGRCDNIMAVFELINKVAQTDTTVLITGETGTGKELVAQTIHYKSLRSGKPFIALNCASLNPNIVESELFGHEKGAFTGALVTRHGRFEDANKGTLFLDEIAETSLEFQAKLLRAIQEGEFERLGGNQKICVDARLIVSTNKDLQNEVKSGRFREDLFYRLCVIPIHLPPLRERQADIHLLASHFLTVYSERYACKVSSISKEGMDYLASLEWKGNVRELQHAIERAVVLSQNEVLDVKDFVAPESKTPTCDDDTLQGITDKRTREYILEILHKTGWRKRRSADILGIDRATLYRLLKKYSITK